MLKLTAVDSECLVVAHDLRKTNLRWLNTVLRAVSGSAYFQIGKKGSGTQKTISQNLLIKICDIWQNFYFCRISNNENFKMEVEQTNFVTQLIIAVQLYY